jgi:hypothetical protein
LYKARTRLHVIALTILVVYVIILVMYDTGWVTGIAGQAQVRLWAVVHSADKVGRGLVQLATLQSTPSCCIAIEDLGEGNLGILVFPIVMNWTVVVVRYVVILKTL